MHIFIFHHIPWFECWYLSIQASKADLLKLCKVVPPRIIQPLVQPKAEVYGMLLRMDLGILWDFFGFLILAIRDWMLIIRFFKEGNKKLFGRMNRPGANFELLEALPGIGSSWNSAWRDQTWWDTSSSKHGQVIQTCLIRKLPQILPARFGSEHAVSVMSVWKSLGIGQDRVGLVVPPTQRSLQTSEAGHTWELYFTSH